MDALQEHSLKPDSKIKINKVEVLLNTVLGWFLPRTLLTRAFHHQSHLVIARAGEVHKVGSRLKNVDEKVRCQLSPQLYLTNMLQPLSTPARPAAATSAITHAGDAWPYRTPDRV